MVPTTLPKYVTSHHSELLPLPQNQMEPETVQNTDTGTAGQGLYPSVHSSGVGLQLGLVTSIKQYPLQSASCSFLHYQHVPHYSR